MSEPTLSAYIQCYSNKAALYQTLKTFRTHYPVERITLVSDAGEDFTRFGRHFNLNYYWSDRHCDPRGELGEAGTVEYLRRIHDHCLNTDSDFVVILEEDVTTYRRIRRFPATACAGPRHNPFSAGLNRYLQRLHRTSLNYGYAMCGGSIFDRRTFVECYERRNLDLAALSTLDPAVIQYSDVPLTLIFLVNGYAFSVWEEVSEMYHPIAELRIVRDAAFDHHDKRWYGAAFDESLLT
jgi:hypothetical protein